MTDKKHKQQNPELLFRVSGTLIAIHIIKEKYPRVKNKFLKLRIKIFKEIFIFY